VYSESSRSFKSLKYNCQAFGEQYKRAEEALDYYTSLVSGEKSEEDASDFIEQVNDINPMIAEATLEGYLNFTEKNEIFDPFREGMLEDFKDVYKNYFVHRNYGKNPELARNVDDPFYNEKFLLLHERINIYKTIRTVKEQLQAQNEFTEAIAEMISEKQYREEDKKFDEWKEKATGMVKNLEADDEELKELMAFTEKDRQHLEMMLKLHKSNLEKKKLEQILKDTSNYRKMGRNRVNEIARLNAELKKKDMEYKTKLKELETSLREKNKKCDATVNKTREYCTNTSLNIIRNFVKQFMKEYIERKKSTYTSQLATRFVKTNTKKIVSEFDKILESYLDDTIQKMDIHQIHNMLASFTERIARLVAEYSGTITGVTHNELPSIRPQQK
jgi:hypothetical protein